jgi:molybdopterin-guanine dinucleotide biosynthesis protein A
MLYRVARTVSVVAEHVIVVAAPGQDLPALPASVRVARDPVPARGPLQGLAAGLGALPESVELVYATATDVPFLQPAWIEYLVSTIGEHDLALPECDGYFHPLAALYRRGTALPAIESLLREGRLRPVFLTEALRTRIVTAEELRQVDPELATVRNLNTIDDYHKALQDAGFFSAQSAAHDTPSPPPKVSVELFGVPRRRAGVGRVEVEACSLGDALRALALAVPALVSTVLTPEGALHPAYTTNLNGDFFTSDSATPLSDGDQILLLAVDAGG